MVPGLEVVMFDIVDTDLYQAGVVDLGRDSRSPKAVMTARDADTVEAILTSVGRRSPGGPRVLEWGSGLSTLTFARALAECVDRFRWVTVEHDREYFVERLAPYLRLSGARIVLVDGDGLPPVLPDDGVVALVYDGGPLRPYIPRLREDRLADLDAYVAGPAQLGTQFDVVVVDGRKRRRCLLEARNLVTGNGVVLLHDAQRPYYQCAWSQYPFGRRIGDELWIGSVTPVDLAALVPEDSLAGPGFEYDPHQFG
jgi:hypothetical protein